MNEYNDPRDLWNRDDSGLPPSFAANEICVLARRRERENIWARRIGLFALAGLASAFAYNTWGLDQPWVRLGQSWMLIVMTVYFWNLIRSRTDRRASNETCSGFLLRSLEKKKAGFIAVRGVVLLTIPGVVASWWGGGAALKARAMGLDPSSLYYRYLTSHWPTVATSALLLGAWLVFSGAAKKASVEAEALRQRIAAV